MSRAIVFHEPGRPLELQRFPLPVVAEGEFLVRVTCCTLCGSDVHTHEGRRSTPCPTVLGHEIIGRLAQTPAKGGALDYDGGSLAIGDRVTWSVAAACGDCFFCNHGLPQKCERLFKYGHERISEAHPLAGGLAEYCHLARGTAVFRVPDDLPDEVACPANCATATAAAAMRYAGECDGQVVLIQGAGTLGLTAAAMASTAGAREVIVCDRLPERLRPAENFGATRTTCVEGGDDQLRTLIDGVTAGRGVDLAIEMSGTTPAIESGIRLLRTGGRYVWVGSVFPAQPLSIAPETVVRKLLSIQGVHNYTPADLRAALRFLECNHARYPFGQLVSRVFSLEEAAAAFAHASQGAALRVAVKM